MSRKYLVPIQLPADPTLALEAATKQYVDAKAGSGSTGLLVDYKVLPASWNPGAGAQFIPGLTLVLPTANRKYLVHVWLVIGADGPGRSFDLSVQMTGAASQENPTAAYSSPAAVYHTIAAEWPVWPTAAGLPTPNTVYGWINCTAGLTVYRGIMRAVDVGPT